MGCAPSSEGGGGVAASEDEVKQSRSIDKLLREEEKRLAREVKVSEQLQVGPTTHRRRRVARRRAM